MGIFKKKNKDNNKEIIEETDKKNKKIESGNKFHYRVYIKEIEDNYTHKKGHFGVERYIDKDKGIVMLRNLDKNFDEPKPSSDTSYKIYKLEEVKKKIHELEKSLAKEIKIDDPRINRKDIEEELRIYKGYERSLMLQGKGSYLNIDEDGTPYFVFRRKGNFRLPEYDNVDIDTIYTPTEAKIKKGSELLDMKNEKYNKFAKNVTTIATVFLIIGIIFLGINMYWSYKINKLSDESAVTQLKNRIDESTLYCAEQYGIAGHNFYQSSIFVNNLTRQLYEDFDKDNKIEGIIPK